MSDKKKRNALLRVYDMLDSLEKVETYIDGYDFEKFSENGLTEDAVVRNIEIIGEATKNLPDEVCAMCPDVPWRDVRAMRDVIAHGYFNVKIEVVWRVAAEELPKLQEPLKLLYADLQKNADSEKTRDA